MSSISENRHTFHYLDAVLPSNKVSSLDTFFLELDVATHMVEGKLRRGAARATYHTLRAAAIAVQMVAYAIFTAVKYIGMACKYIITKAVMATFVTMPAAVQRALFPTAADFHKERVETCKSAIKEKTFSTEHIVGSKDSKRTFNEKKQLLHALLIQPIKNQPFYEPEWEECCDLMVQIANGGLREDEIEKKEGQVRDIVRLKKGTPIRDASVMIEKFLEAFKSEREFESRLTTHEIAQNPKLLLAYPHLLVREDVETIITSVDEEFKTRLLSMKASVLDYRFKQLHQRELDLINNLSKTVQEIDFDGLEEKFLSLEETRFLEERLGLLEDRIGELEDKEISGGFEFFLLKFEYFRLRQQQEKMEATRRSINSLQEKEEAVREMNGLHEETRALFCEALEARIRKTLTSGSLTKCLADEKIAKCVNGLQEKLKKLEDLESLEEELEALTSMVRELHQLEILMSKKGEGNNADLRCAQKSLIACENMYRNISLLNQTPIWENFTALTTLDAREEVRQNNLAKDVLCLLLETKPECQIPLLLAKQDGRTLYHSVVVGESAKKPLKGVYKRVDEASEEFMDAMRDKYLEAVKKRLPSITEFASQVSKGEAIDIIEENEGLKEGALKGVISLKEFGLKLQTAESLSKWYVSLQKIWIEHMPREQEEMLLSISSSQKQQIKMAECFEQWFEKTTGKKLGVQLTFNHLTVPNHAAEREEALRIISKRVQKKPLNLSSLAQKVRTKGTTRKEGFAPDKHLILKSKEATSLTEVAIPSHAFEEIEVDSQEFNDIVRGLELIASNLDRYYTPESLAWKENWIAELNSYIQLNGCQSLRLMMLTECKELIQYCFENNKKISSEIRNIFLQQYVVDGSHGKEIRFETMHNFERAEFLKHLLMSVFSSNRPLSISDRDYIRLKQLCSLSSLSQKETKHILSLAQVSAMPSPSELRDLLKDMSKQLQSSPIGLEGVEAEIVRSSFKESELPHSRETRMWLDSFMSRGTDALSFHLIDRVYDLHGEGMEHNAAREAIARALSHAYSEHPEETKAYILKKIKENKHDLDLDEHTFAPPIYVFYCDLLRQLDPEAYFSKDSIQRRVGEFNSDLLKENEINHLLMGFSRAISQLSYEIQYKYEKGKDCERLICKLLKYKIAYQNLKKNHFDGKIEISDFLRIDADLAESAMLMVEPIMQEYLREEETLEAIEDYLKELMRSFDPSLTKQCVIRELGGTHGNIVFKPTKVRDFFKLSPGIVLDALSGIVYNDGQQKVQLPPCLQNHPSIHTLGCQNFPYVWDPVLNGYVYYVQHEDGKSYASLIVKSEESKPVIQKKLPTRFAREGRSTPTAYLQFVPKEDIHLPIATMHRMNIEQFWQDEEKLYGYDSKGKLVAIFTEDSVKTEEETYVFLTEENKSHVQKLPVFSLLSKNFSPNEILVNKTLSTFYIPALDLKLKRDVNHLGKEVWVCQFKDGSEKELLPSPEGTSLLLMENRVEPEKLHAVQRRFKEASYRKELMQIKHPSLTDKYRLKKLEEAITREKKEYMALKQPQFMMTCSDEAYQKGLIDSIVNMMPGDVRYEFEEACEDMEHPYEVFPLALHFLRESIDTANQNEWPQSHIDPLLTAYLKIQKRSKSVCDKPLEPVFFDKSIDGSALSKDRTGALTLIVNQLEAGDLDPQFLMKELAKYPLDGPLTSSQFALLTRSLALLELEEEPKLELEAYLKFLRYHHFLYKVREITMMAPSVDKQKMVERVQGGHHASLEACSDIIEQLENVYVPEETHFSKELLTLWRKTGIQREHECLEEAEVTNFTIEKQVNPTFAIELQVLGAKSPLEKAAERPAIEAVPKSPTKELSEHQRDLTSTLRSTSHSQVAGFYFEKMGYFSLRELQADFRVNAKGRALYGLRVENVTDIFLFLKEEKLITSALDSMFYNRLTSADCAGKSFPVNKLRARLASLPIDEENLQKAIERVQGFLFRAMQSGFEFSFIGGEEKEVDKKLNEDKQVYLQKSLEAEAILKTELLKYNATMVDLKYAYLTGDYQKFLSPTEDNHRELARLCTGMTRYLFYKTEVQHIENIQRAPTKGERNKIQLLQTKRNYSIDLLLQEGLTGQKRIEQIMQRAYLAFEEDFGGRCNLMQIRMFRSLMLNKKNIESIDAIQARMGFGKTALLPLLGLVKVAFEKAKPAEDRFLVRYVVPRAVLEDNTSSFNNSFSSILGKKVVQDRDFSRYQIDQEDPHTSLQMIIIDLKSRLHFYEEMRREGNIIIQPPEIRCSMEAQDLYFAEMLLAGNGDKETLGLCLEAKRLLVTIRSIPTYNIFDELDDTQDFRSREVNFTVGAKLPIPTETIRPMEQLVSYIEKNKHLDWSDKRARAEEMVMALCTDREGKKIGYCPEELIDYLSARAEPINEETKEFLSEKLVDGLENPETAQTENDALFFLIRMVLLDKYILSLIKSKEPSTHFGIRFSIDPETLQRQFSYDPGTHSALLISVPYEGVNTPKGLSVFDNREVAALTTLRYYLSNETSFAIQPHLDFLVTQIREDTLPSHLTRHYLPGRGSSEHPAIEALRKMAKILDVHELEKAKKGFYEEFMQTPTEEFRKFFAMAVIATQIRSDEGCAKSDRYEEGSPTNVSLGCSGTVGDTSSYFTKQAPDPAADGMLSIEIMGRDNNSTIEWLESPKPREEQLPAIIKTLLDHAKPNTRAIADIAGMCKSRDGTPEAVIRELWGQLKSREQFADIEGIIYYGKDNVKRLYRGDKEPIACTSEMEAAAIREGRKYFSFYKQKNCRGSDIKQAHEVHFLVTMDENVSNSDAKQTILRFRNIVTRDSGQSFSFAAMPGYKRVIIEQLKSEKGRAYMEAANALKEVQKEIRDTVLERRSDRKNEELKAKLSSLKQEATRLEKTCEALKEELLQVKKLEPKAKDIAYFLRVQEKNTEQENALTLFRKEMKAHIKVAAGHLEAHLLSQIPGPLTEEQEEDYLTFLDTRNKLSPLIERSLNSLYEKYGLDTKDMPRDTFVKWQKKITKEALEELFEAANAFAGNHELEVKIDQKIYLKRVKASIKSFNTRFPEDKMVQISSTPSDGQNLALAEAQSEAQAQAQACTETLKESFVEAQERIWTPRLLMTKNPREKVSFNFLAQSRLLKGVEKFPGLAFSIMPRLRDAFFVSPGLWKKQEVSHFALFNHDAKTYIFISQEEAEAFKELKEQEYGSKSRVSKPFSNFSLLDLRAPEFSVEATPDKVEMEDTPYFAQLRCVALGDNGIPEKYYELTTEDVRATSLVNVESHQLLPHLEVRESEGGYFEPTEFGLAKDMQYNILLQPMEKEDALEVRVAIPSGPEIKAKMLLKNKPLTKVMRKVNNGKQKIATAHAIIEGKLRKQFPKLEELKRKQMHLEELNRRNRELIANVGNFDLSESMKRGLEERDKQFRPGSGWDINESMYGVEAIKICKEISRLQKKVGKEFSIKTLRELKQTFDQFVSEGMYSEKSRRTYTTDVLFSKKEWDMNKGGMSILAQVYGRIVHSIHGSDPSDALGCHKKDCNQLFTKVIPDILDVMPKLCAAIKEIERNEQEKAKIQKEIDEMMKKAGPLIEAEKCLQDLLKEQENIEWQLEKQGLLHNRGEFFDQFNFPDLMDVQPTVKIAVEGTLPDYIPTVTKDMPTYEKAFRGLTGYEGKNYQKNRAFLNHVLILARRVENRQAEVVWP